MQNTIMFGSKSKNFSKTNPNSPNSYKQRTTIIADIHGVSALPNIITGMKVFALKSKYDGSNHYVVLPGDLVTNCPTLSKHKTMYNDFLNKITSYVVTTLGNHDLEVHKWKKFVGIVKKTKAIILSSNLTTATPGHVLKTIMADRLEIFSDQRRKVTTSGQKIHGKQADDARIFHSVIIHEKDGQTVGFIGVSPNDEELAATSHEYKKNELGIKTLSLEETLKSINEEIVYMKKKGVQTISLVAHWGRKINEQVKQRIQGVDFINLGHTHEVYDGITTKNLHYDNQGKHVISTEVASEGVYIGECCAKLQNGVIVQASNKIYSTKNFATDTKFKAKMSKTFKYDPKPLNNLIIDNPNYLLEGIKPEEFLAFYFKLPMAGLVTEATKTQAKAQVSLMNISGIRNPLLEGDLNKMDVASAFFNNDIHITHRSEKDLFDAFSNSAKSFYTESFYPERMLYTSGAGYTIKEDGSIKDVWYEDKEGAKKIIDIKNPSEEKNIKVAYDNFLHTGMLGYDSLKAEITSAKKPAGGTMDLFLRYVEELKSKGETLKIEQKSNLLFENPLNKAIQKMKYLVKTV